MRHFAKHALIAASLFAALWVFNADYEDEKKREDYTCSMIHEGSWPLDVAPWCEERDASLRIGEGMRVTF